MSWLSRFMNRNFRFRLPCVGDAVTNEEGLSGTVSAADSCSEWVRIKFDGESVSRDVLAEQLDFVESEP